MFSYIELINGTKYSIGISVWNGKDYSKVKRMISSDNEYRVYLENETVVYLPFTSVLLAIQTK